MIDVTLPAWALGAAVGLAGVGAHLIANSRIEKLKKTYFHRHAVAVTAIADAAVEVMAVEYGADIAEAAQHLEAAAKKRVPTFVMQQPAPEVCAKAREKVAELRAAKEKANAQKAG